MSKITFEEYKKAVRAKYAVKKRDDVSGILLNPTPAQLRNLCLLLFENGLNTTDENIFSMFFNAKEVGSIRRAIVNFDVSKFKPIISFLKEEKDSEHVTRIELAAVIVDFIPRPYSKYLQSDENETAKIPEFLPVEKNEIMRKVYKLSEEPIVIISKNNTGKSIAIGFLVLLSLCFMGYTVKGVFFPKKECMQWKEDHYEEVDCGINQLAIGQLNTVFPLDENTIHLKKVNSNHKLTFFKNGNALIWYSKNEGVIELFNTSGFNPETGKPLKPITKYIIEKYKLQK
ncbi:hypothetical protein SAMN05444396_101280 [Flavobacterium segetis]|uniref:Uncharacterized protein n=1 Tax=Flavobacterium segetis TaxID=271157 RepID=A0A1M5EBW2_9FLAO|nr:hypothetical protein [Flavobacterium segetis]SHF76561.1 hypothetical protein SAMN05444396_101280 [Flavobacterium segetis]